MVVPNLYLFRLMKTILFAVALFFAIFQWGMSSHSATMTGIPALDKAIANQAPIGMLPLWYKYPYKKIDKAQADEYSAFFVKTLKTHGQDLLTSIPSDIGWYCPRYLMLSNDERVIFWTRFISIFPEFESTFVAGQETEETADHIKGVISSGFFQISLASVTNGGYGCKNFIDEQGDLLDWKKNTTCAVKMLSKFMREHNVINWNKDGGREKDWIGFSRYWGIARGQNLKTPQGRAQLMSYLDKKRPQWIQDGLSDKHPAYNDEQFRTIMTDQAGKVVLNKKGKPKKSNNFFERILYRMNQTPFCH